jgi:hypothetical protein
MRSKLFLLPLACLLASAGISASSQTPVSGDPRPAASATTNAAPGDKLVCKKRLRTGTLADYEKICHTKAQWERIGAAWRDTWAEMQGIKGSTHGH